MMFYVYLIKFLKSGPLFLYLSPFPISAGNQNLRGPHFNPGFSGPQYPQANTKTFSASDITQNFQ